MTIREALNQKPALYGSIGAGVLILALSMFLWHMFGNRGSHLPNKEFFSDDDGQTWFVDSAAKIPPFDHDGKPAYRARLFRCGDGKIFASCLERYDQEAMAKAENMKAEALERGPAVWGGHIEPDNFLEVKRPGEQKWVGHSDFATFSAIIRPTCPGGGSDPPIPVYPD